MAGVSMAIITGFFDHMDSDVSKQIEIAKRLDIKHISLRQFGKHHLLNVTHDQLKTLQAQLKKEKMTLQVIDAAYNYGLIGFDPKALSTLFDHAQNAQTKMLLLELPNLENFDLQHDELRDHLKSIIEETKKKSFTLVFKMNQTYKTGVVAYLINQVKGIKFVYDAGLIKRQKASVTTTYRIMKKHIEFAVIYDLDKTFEPALLGYGSTGVMDVVKRMSRDKFKGSLIIDMNLLDYIKNRTEAYAKKKFFGLFSKDKKIKASYEKMDSVLGLKETDNLDYISMLKIYVQVLNQAT